MSMNNYKNLNLVCCIASPALPSLRTPALLRNATFLVMDVRPIVPDVHASMTSGTTGLTVLIISFHIPLTDPDPA